MATFSSALNTVSTHRTAVAQASVLVSVGSHSVPGECARVMEQDATMNLALNCDWVCNGL